MSFKDDLGEALQKAVSYYNEGSSPSEAVVKSAMDMGFNLDQTDRLVEKFNTARTIHHFETHPDDRTATFDLASKEKVASILSDGGHEKKASAETVPGWHDYSSYDVEDEDMFADHPDGEVVKQASAMDEQDVSGYSVDGLERIIVSRADEHREMAKVAEDAAGMVMSEITTELSKIASKVVSGYDPEERYARFRAACSSYPAFGSFDGLVPEHVKKAAAQHEKELSRQNIIDLGDMAVCAEELKYLGDAAARADRLNKHAEAHRKARRMVLDRAYKTAGLDKKAVNMPGGTRGGGNGGNGGNGGQAQQGGQGGKGRDKEKERRRRSTLEFLGVGSETIPDIRKTVTLGADEEDIVKALRPRSKGPSLKDHIDNLRRSDVLNDLYANDPIISEADPNDVMSAYKTIVQSSPEVSMNKEVVRAILRQSVNSVAVSPFDVKQWADLENVTLKNRAYAKGRYDKYDSKL